MEYVLVSSCLLGKPVRYDARAVSHDNAVLARWLKQGRVVAVCPEVAGGLPVPRPPAEIEPGAAAATVLAGRARIVAVSGEDVTAPFVQGAREALAAARRHAIRVAVLKDGLLQQCDTPRNMYDHPKNVFVATFEENLFNGDKEALAEVVADEDMSKNDD